MSILQSSVLLMGGGIAGNQISLNLTELVIKVSLVEKTPSIKEKMTLLNKIFTPLECSL